MNPLTQVEPHAVEARPEADADDASLDVRTRVVVLALTAVTLGLWCTFLVRCTVRLVAWAWSLVP